MIELFESRSFEFSPPDDGPFSRARDLFHYPVKPRADPRVCSLMPCKT